MFRRLCSRRKRTTARIVTDGSETLCVATQIVGCGAGVPSMWAAAGRLGSHLFAGFPTLQHTRKPNLPECLPAITLHSQFPPQTRHHLANLSANPGSCRARAHHGGRGLAAIWHGTPTVSYNLQSYSPTVLQSYRPVLPTTYNLQSCKQDWNTLVSH
jgi:hypothetical protein